MPLKKSGLVEDDLIVRAQRGDAQAFGDLYEHYLNAIYRYVYYRVGEVAEAEDLTEMVFLKAWEALDKYEVRDVPFSAWLYRIAHNVVVDRHRTHKDNVSLDATLPLQDEAAGPEDQIDALENIETLSRALSQLLPDYQQVLTLRFISGLSHADTGRVLKRSEEAVRVLQYRALSALRKLLGKEREMR
jgi:RNA polymerase sigma-70 factor (ECF subfamily)